MDNGKTIVFDFDGTLTEGDNSWRVLWETASLYTGNDSVFSMLYNEFLSGKINHQEWCDKTCYWLGEYNRSTLTKDKAVAETKKRITLLDGANETFENLKKDGYRLCVLSGAPDIAIKAVMGDAVKYFDIISSNKVFFDNNGRMSQIKGTPYDFDGKADFIKDYAKNTMSSMEDILFVGDDFNDVSVRRYAGCRTLCINPKRGAFAQDNGSWDCVLKDVKDLRNVDFSAQFNPESCEEMEA